MGSGPYQLQNMNLQNSFGSLLAPLWPWFSRNWSPGPFLPPPGVNRVNPTQVSSYQIDLCPSKYVPPTRKHKLQLISNKVYPLNWYWWRRINVVLKILLWGTNCFLWISKLNAGSTKALHSHNTVYMRYMEGYIWLLFKIQSFAWGRTGRWK